MSNSLIPDDASVPKSLAALAAAIDTCRRCALYKNATQAVPGEGPRAARLMLVGEVPGNDEDLKGKPFVGPAGRILDAALARAGIERKEAFVTNAVKHFKFELRGKRRLHKRPDAYEIQRCRWWLERERDLVKPELTVALGATAARSVFGRTVTVSSLRGKVMKVEGWGAVLVTIHPSYILRIPDPGDSAREDTNFVRDLKAAKTYVDAL